jgi:hypothetical protein
MPFRSQAERERLRKLTQEGKFPQQDYDRLDAETTGDLPERLGPSKKAKGPVKLSTGGSERYRTAEKQRLY